MASWEQLVEYGRQLGPDPDLAELGTDDLERQVRSQAATIAAATARWIVLVAELVVRGVWADQGARTPGAWLSWSVGMAPTTARDHVRVGLALRNLPRIRAAFLAGKVSYSKVRAVTRLADDRTEDVLLEWMDAAPAAELERVVALTRRSCRIDGVEADPFVSVDPTDASAEAARIERFDWHQEDDGAVVLRIRMDEVDGARAISYLRWLSRQQDESLPAPARIVAAFDQALTAAMDSAPVDSSGLDRDRLVVDASLVEVATGQSSGDDRPSREHRTDSAESPAVGRPPNSAGQLHLVPRPGPAGLPAMSARTLRRLACTAGIVSVVVDQDGSPLDVGREQRRATAKQRRALRVRDPMCRFPGCTASRHLHAHHAIEWDDQGPTDLDNLLHLCGFHHRFVHRASWRFIPRGRGAFDLLDARGRTIPAAGTDSAESPRSPSPGLVVSPSTDSCPADSAESPDPLALQPPWWDGTPPDLDLCVQVLRRALDQRPRSSPPEPTLAAA